MPKHSALRPPIPVPALSRGRQRSDAFLVLRERHYWVNLHPRFSVPIRGKEKPVHLHDNQKRSKLPKTVQPNTKIGSPLIDKPLRVSVLCGKVGVSVFLLFPYSPALRAIYTPTGPKSRGTEISRTVASHPFYSVINEVQHKMSSQSQPEIVLYDLACTKNECFSPAVWRIRLMLNYKKVPYQTIFLELQDIEPTLKAL